MKSMYKVNAIYNFCFCGKIMEELPANICIYFVDRSFKECDGRISLAYERLSIIPKSIAEQFSQSTHTLDLSHNNIKWVLFFFF